MLLVGSRCTLQYYRDTGNVRWSPPREVRAPMVREVRACYTRLAANSVFARLHLQLLVICACAHIALLSEN